MARRLAGDGLSDQELIGAHPELLPELAQELKKVGMIMEARRRARASSAGVAGDETRASTSTGIEGGGDRSRDAGAWGVGGASAGLIAGYAIQEEIHRGGQGVVYRAVQSGTSRIVAVKVMREGPFAGPHDRARFEREVHILAQLRHPNIVTIHDSGVAAGCHYFVMDYVAGRPLDRFIEERRTAAGSGCQPAVDLESAVALFATVCEAVNAAHLQGVIHRDLKPGNVIVDEQGQPRVLDFGLAKFTPTDVDPGGDVPGSPGRAMTATGQFIGSLPWASPEQVEGAPGRIDLRTDVYSLGVMLYQVIGGCFPYDVSGSFREVVSNILTRDPQRPSGLRRGGHDARARWAGSRQWSSGRRRGRAAMDELDTIVLKCLAKDRERRYQSAGELARDLRRFLAGEPIEAKRDSVGYLLRKQLRRYRVPAGVVAAFLVVIIAGLAVSLRLWQVAAAQRDEAVLARGAERAHRLRAERARDAAQAARSEAESARADQEAEAARAGAVSAFLRDMLASADPESSRERDVTVRELLDEASQQLEAGSLLERPEVELAVRTTVGKTYRSLGRYPAAEPHLERAAALAERLHGREGAEWAEARFELGSLWSEMGRAADAQEAYEDALRVFRRLAGEDDLRVARVLASLGPLLYSRGKISEADAASRQALWIRQQRLPRRHALIADSLSGVARIAWGEGKLDEAEELLRAALEIDQDADERPRMRAARGLNNLAELMRDRGRYADAEPLYTRSLSIRRQLLGDEHPDVARAMYNLAQLYWDQERYGEARDLHAAALAMRRRLLPESHPDIASSLTGLAAAQRALGERASAIENVELARDIHYRNEGERGTNYQSAIANLGTLYFEAGRYDEAEAMLRRSHDLLREILGPTRPAVGEKAYNLALLLKLRGRFADSEPFMREALGIFRSTYGAAHASIAAVLQNLSEVLMELERFEEAETALRECLDMRLNRLPTEAWLVGTTRSLLGEALSRQRRFEEAQPLLLEGFAAIDAHPKVPVAWKRRAAERVARLYEAWGKPEFVATWRERYPDSQPAEGE